jgi:hypothetical protein
MERFAIHFAPFPGAPTNLHRTFLHKRSDIPISGDGAPCLAAAFIGRSYTTRLHLVKVC